MCESEILVNLYFSYLEWFSSLYACTLNFGIRRFFQSSLLVDVPHPNRTTLNFSVFMCFFFLSVIYCDHKVNCTHY